MKLTLIYLFILTHFSLVAQNEVFKAFPEVDSLYREDQFYIGATFHIIGNRPNGINQSGFSGGLHAGFIRDIPFTKKRNWAIGLGLGYSINTYNHNLLLLENTDSKATIFRAPIDTDNFKENRFKNHIIEIPFELRWRTSTPTTYKFWRIYAGMRLGYMHYFKANFESSNGNKLSIKRPNGLNRIRLGSTLTFGWNTFNFHIYYSLNDFFDKSAQIENQQGGFTPIKIGLLFYIL